MKGPVTKEYLLFKGKADTLDKIGSLDLSNHSITQIESNLFNKLEELKTLDLSCNQLQTIPEDLSLKHLAVLDCCDNDLQSVNFVRHLKGLKELYIGGNRKMVEEDHFIAKLLAPTLVNTDSDGDMTHIIKGLDLYRSQLTSPIEAVWEAKFAEVYSNGISVEELEDLHKELVQTVHRAEVVGSNLSMHRLRDKMIEQLCKELLVSINKGSYRHGRRQKTDNNTTRVSKRAAPVKDYREMAGEKKNPEKGLKSESPTKVQSTNKRKREATPTKSPAAKRQRQGDAVVAFSPVRVKEAGKTKLPEVDEFEPSMFLRCHSKNNDPADMNTKVWKCAFEPKLGKTALLLMTTVGETTNIVATCGGKIVCLIDCQTTKVMRRYKDSSLTESFYSLAWTTLRADGENLKEDVNILAVAGEDCTIKLIHPRQLLMFGTLEGHKNYISSLVFHPTQSQILFSGSRDSKIIMWEIGMPDFKDNTIEWSKKAILTLSHTDAIGMVIDPSLDLLVAGCEDSCFAWNLKHLLTKGAKSQVSPDYEFVHPIDDAEEEETVVDGLVMMDKHCVVSKCVGQNCLYLWDIKAHVLKDGKKRSKGSRVPVQPLAQLGYVPVDVDYLFPHANSDLLCVGDDEGRLFMYNLKSVIKNKHKKPANILMASKILDAPEMKVDKMYETKMIDITSEKEKETVINCVSMSSDQEYLVYGTDNNLVCIWRNASKL